MQTFVLPVDAVHPEPEAIHRAAEAIRGGKLVAFPTETVYGLGANALDERAVERIFSAKGRPATNPLIVHVASVDEARRLAAAWPESAERLAARFWPGPVSFVLPKAGSIPDVVTAGGQTVALRVPRHPVALALLESSGVPIAAPSANRSNRLSPTLARHVLADFDGRIELILDGGAATGGLESTVVDLTSRPPRVLRLGLLSPDSLEAALGGPIALPEVARAPGAPLPSPGMMSRHYAPRAALECAADDGHRRVMELLDEDLRVGWLTFGMDAADYRPGLTVTIMPRDAAEYSARFYAALHTLDDADVERIVVAQPPQGPAWLAIHDRLRRAAAPG